MTRALFLCQAKVQWDITGFEGTYKMGAMAEDPTNSDEQSPAAVDDLLVRYISRWFLQIGPWVLMVLFYLILPSNPEHRRKTPAHFANVAPCFHPPHLISLTKYKIRSFFGVTHRRRSNYY